MYLFSVITYTTQLTDIFDLFLNGFHRPTYHTIELMRLAHRRLTHWGRVTHICVSKQTIIGSDNGLSPGRRQAIIWTSAGILLIGPLETNFSEILIGIQTFSFKKMHLKMSSAKWRPFCPGLNVLTTLPTESTCDPAQETNHSKFVFTLLSFPATCPHGSSIPKNNIYTPVPGVSSLVDNRSCP